MKSTINPRPTRCVIREVFVGPIKQYTVALPNGTVVGLVNHFKQATDMARLYGDAYRLVKA